MRDTILIEPKDAEVVRLIFEKYVNEGLGLDVISNYLNQHGYKKPKIKSRDIDYFSRSFLAKLIDNPVYCGKIAYGRRKTEKIRGSRDQYHRVKNENPMIVDGKHEAIIDEELWNAAQEKRKKKAIPWVKTHSLEHEHVLTGLLTCPVCGSRMIGAVYRYRNRKTGEYKDTFYYKCLHRRKIDEDHFCNYRFNLRQELVNAQVAEVVSDMIRDDAFNGYIKDSLGKTVDTAEMEKDKKLLQDKLRQIVGAKEKLMTMMDALDINDRHYNRKYQDMQDRLDNLYDKISEMEDAISDVNAKINSVSKEKLTAEELYKVLEHWDDVYTKMTDLEKKKFFRSFIEDIHLFPDKKADERIIKQIDFKFPIYYDGEKRKGYFLLNESPVETVVLMSRAKD